MIKWFIGQAPNAQFVIVLDGHGTPGDRGADFVLSCGPAAPRWEYTETIRYAMEKRRFGGYGAPSLDGRFATIIIDACFAAATQIPQPAEWSSAPWCIPGAPVDGPMGADITLFQFAVVVSAAVDTVALQNDLSAALSTLGRLTNSEAQREIMATGRITHGVEVAVEMPDTRVFDVRGRSFLLP